MKTKHNLEFEVAQHPIVVEFLLFRVGTAEGLWRDGGDTYDILAIKNSAPGNGHLDDVFEWFENSCKRDGKNLRIMELWNQKFAEHLVKKRGFVNQQGTEHYIKQIV